MMYFGAILALAVAASAQTAIDVTPGPYVVAPRSVITPYQDGVERRSIGPAGWMCTYLNVSFPEGAYQRLKGYQDGGNEEGIMMNVLETFPIVELYSDQMDCLLCIYLDAPYRCYPPRPYSDDIFHVNQHYELEYYGRSFWGQASTARLEYEHERLIVVLEELGVDDVIGDVVYLSSFPDHERELRYDAFMEYPAPPAPPTPFPVSVNATTPAYNSSLSGNSTGAPPSDTMPGNRTLSSRMISLY